LSDAPQWEPPGAPMPSAPTSAAVADPVIAPVAPPAVGAAGAGSWTPPPRPGLVPLRPLGLGTVIAASFGTLRRNPLATYGPALLVSLALAVVKSVGTISLLSTLFASGSSDTAAVGAVFSGLGDGVVTFVGSTVLALIADQIVLAFVGLAVAGSTVGERRPAGAVWRRTAGRRLAVLGWGLLLAGGGVLVLGIGTGLVLLFVSLGGVGVGLGVLVAAIGIPGALVLWFWLTTKFAFVPPALVVERLRMGAAVRRSWRLTRGAGTFWRVLGIRLLVSVMVGFAQMLLGLPLQLIASLVVTLALPNGSTEDSGRTALIITTLVTQLAGSFVAGVATVLTTATTALLYVDVRMRKEGLDLVLAHYVETPPGSRRGMPDPFRRPENAA
jgi:hypothetical protein